MRKYLNDKMFRIIANAILIGKINYHLLIWPYISKKNIRKTNKIIINVARLCFGQNHYGRTDEYILKQIKWFTIEDYHTMETLKFTHKLLNKNENYYLKNIITYNRERKTLAENKIGTLKSKFGHKTNEQNSFIFKAANNYNKLPRLITLITKPSNFKKWLKNYYIDNNIKLKKNDNDHKNTKNISDYEIDTKNIEKCYKDYG